MRDRDWICEAGSISQAIVFEILMRSNRANDVCPVMIKKLFLSAMSPMALAVTKPQFTLWQKKLLLLF